MPKIKKIWIVVISISLFLLITNPSPSRYEEYSGGKKANRKYNLLIFSIYYESKEDAYYFEKDDFYIGIALNFFKIE